MALIHVLADRRTLAFCGKALGVSPGALELFGFPFLIDT